MYVGVTQNDTTTRICVRDRFRIEKKPWGLKWKTISSYYFYSFCYPFADPNNNCGSLWYNCPFLSVQDLLSPYFIRQQSQTFLRLIKLSFILLFYSLFQVFQLKFFITLLSSIPNYHPIPFTSLFLIFAKGSYSYTVPVFLISHEPCCWMGT